MTIDYFLKDFSEEEKKEWWKNHYESERKREEFMKQYDKDHKCCPKCGGVHYSTTLMGFAYDSEHPHEYKDRNTCTCRCGDKHEFHDRVPLTNP